MTRFRSRLLTTFSFFLASASVTTAFGQYAAQVISYSQGTTAITSFLSPLAALGEPEHFTGEGIYPGIVTPFNPPWLTSEIVSVGEGGQITLRLSNYAVAQAGGLPEIGIFGNVGVLDIAYPNGQAGSPADPLSPIGVPTIEVSADGASWFGLGSAALDVPTNGYTDITDPNSSSQSGTPSDFQKPFVGSLSSFNGLPFAHPSNPDMLELLAGSGGGKWLDISPAGLSQIGFVRLSLADDGLADTALKFELDALSVSHAALGGSVPEPASVIALLTTLLPATMLRRRPSRRPWTAAAPPAKPR